MKYLFSSIPHQKTVQQQIQRLLATVFVPVVILLLGVFAISLAQSRQYAGILHNVTMASEFNQDFKDSIDLKMYYYITECQYSEGLPIDEVTDAQALARSLLHTTTVRESRKAISSVLNLCENLEEKIYQIEATDTYDSRQTQLENNIYVLTALIEKYMYTYLYHEAAWLNALQAQISRQITYVLLFAAVFIALLIWFLVRRTVRLGQSIAQPIAELCSRVEEIGDGDLSMRAPVQTMQYEIQALSESFEHMVGQLHAQIEKNKQEQEQLYRTELALLQAQISPHFLYNTLDTTIWLIEAGRNDDAVEMVSKLSSFFRSFLSRGNDIITIHEEERHIRSYLGIQKMRYQDILNYEICLDPAISRCRIPKLTLQPLIENALYHGIKMKRGLGQIQVCGKRQDDTVVICVQDNGAGISEERLAELRRALENPKEKVGFGLVSVHERLQLFYGKPYGLSIESTQGVGTTITVCIPWVLQEEAT